MIDGKPAFLLDKKKCPTLYKGFSKEYVYDRLAVAGEERYRDKPTKNMCSHPMNALEYGCLEIASDRIVMDKMAGKEPENMWNPVFRWQ